MHGQQNIKNRAGIIYLSGVEEKRKSFIFYNIRIQHSKKLYNIMRFYRQKRDLVVKQ